MNDDGQLGLGDENERNLPERILKSPDNVAKFIKIACGCSHTVLLGYKNQVYSFGQNDYGQLGLGD